MSTVAFEDVCGARAKRRVMVGMNKFNIFITAMFVSYFLLNYDGPLCYFGLLILAVILMTTNQLHKLQS